MLQALRTFETGIAVGETLAEPATGGAPSERAAADAGGPGDDLILGTPDPDHLVGYDGNDTLRGRAGDDELFGGPGRDRLEGGRGDDLLAGGRGADRMIGGEGNDTYVVDHIGDRVIELAGGGRDTMVSTITTRIAPHVERLLLIGDARIDARGRAGDDVLDGNAGRNRLEGGSGDDRLGGGGGNDTLQGGGGHDRLHGGTGADRLDGGVGNDILTGGGRGDVFRFRGTGDADGDRILDFGRGADRIDLSEIDTAPRRGNQGFDWIGDDAFSGRAGELRYVDGRLSGDLDGDAAADFTIRLDPEVDLSRADLIL